jgi:hypothetical protein
MKWQGVLAVVAGATWAVSSLAVTGVTSAQAAPATSGTGAAASPWGKPIEVPGLGALNKGDSAFITSISCVSAGNCSAAGSYAPEFASAQGFVVSEKNGRWGKAIELPGLSSLNKNDQLLNISVSCSAAGNCAAAGSDLGGRDGSHSFIANENNGTWGKAFLVPGLAALATKNVSELTSLSCNPGRNCTAVGTYETGQVGTKSFHGTSFVVSERNGRWGRAMTLPGLGKLDATGSGGLETLSCASAGNCSAGGGYAVGGTGTHDQNGFVVSEKNGKWGQPIAVPGLAALNPSGEAEVDQISCGSAGNCVAGGLTNSPSEQAFVVREKNGTWGKAIVVPGLKALNTGELASVQSISCVSAGNCAVSGTFEGDTGIQGYVISEKNGTWGKAIEIPNLATLNRGSDVDLVEVSCASAGNCAAGGYYNLTRSNDTPTQTFVASESKGVWGKATQLPGLKTLNFGSSAINAISCPSSGHCAAGGFYDDHSDNTQGFVVNQK